MSYWQNGPVSPLRPIEVSEGKMDMIVSEGSKHKAVGVLLVALIAVVLLIGQIQGAEKEVQKGQEAPLEPSLELGTKTYNWYCTPCHGVKGDGTGPNTRNLFVKPANHIDPKFMSTRTDEKLFDVINMGGKGISKSALMPPWGAAIGDVRIQSLILKLRDLCKCSAAGASR